MSKHLHIPYSCLSVSAYCLTISIISANLVYGQQGTPKTISMNEAVALTLTNNPISKNAELQVQAIKSQSTTLALPLTEFNYANGQFYSTANDAYFEINQHLGSPLTQIQKTKYNKQAVKLSEVEQKIAIKKLTAEAKIAYTNFVYQQAKLSTIKELSPLYSKILAASGVPYNPNDTNQLNRAVDETSFANFQNQLFQAEQDCSLASNNLQQIMNSPLHYIPSDSSLELYAIEILNNGPNKFNPATNNALYHEALVLRQKELQVQQSKLFPEFTAGYFNHEINGAKGFQGYKLGIALPIWYFPQKAKIVEARINLEIAKNKSDYQKFNLNKTIENLKIQLDKLFVEISFYKENALKKANLLFQQANQNSQKKDLDYSNLFENLESGLKIRLDYLERIYHYNHIAIQLESMID